MGIKTIQETPADSKHNNPKLSPSEIITGTPVVHAFEFLHSGGQSSLNSFLAGEREQQPSALSAGTEPSTRAWVPGTAGGGGEVLQPGVHSQPAHGSRYRELPPDTASAGLQGCSAGHTSIGNSRAWEPEPVRPMPRWPG